MIIDNLSHAKRYYSMHPHFKEAFSFLSAALLQPFSPGVFELKGSELKAIVEEVNGRSKENAPLEAHRKYIDIQYAFEGQEEMGWSEREQCKTISLFYNPEKDIEFFADAPSVFVPVPKGSFVIFFPEDAHAPCVATGTLKKIVMKIAVASNSAQKHEEKLKKIKLVVLDIDGTLTDGGMHYSHEGDMLKRFYVQDGMGITLLKRAGIAVAFLTSENSPIVAARAKKLGIQHVILGCQAKKQALETLCNDLSISLDEVAYMGDDVNDEAAMQIAGFKACPVNAVDRIVAIADLVTSKPGGQGAFRELAELLLQAQGHSNTLPEVW